MLNLLMQTATSDHRQVLPILSQVLYNMNSCFEKMLVGGCRLALVVNQSTRYTGWLGGTVRTYLGSETYCAYEFAARRVQYVLYV